MKPTPETNKNFILIERGDGYGTLVRSKVDCTSEDPLTEHELIINQLYQYTTSKDKEITELKKRVEELEKEKVRLDLAETLWVNVWPYLLGLNIPEELPGLREGLKEWHDLYLKRLLPNTK